MLCRRCMTVMKPGTTYEQNKNGQLSSKRFHKCKKCNDKVYTKEPNFQEFMNKKLEKKK